MTRLAPSVPSVETIEKSVSALVVDPTEQKSYRFGKPDIKDLTNKIKEEGQLKPVVAIMKHHGDPKPTVLYGFARIEAIEAINKDLPPNKQMKVKVQVYDWKQKRNLFLRNLVEHIVHGDMSHMDYAVTIRTMIYDMGMTQADAAGWFDKSQSWVSQHVSMFNLEPKMQEMVHSGRLPWSIAVNIAAADPKDHKAMLEALEESRAAQRIGPGMSLRVRPRGSNRSLQEVMALLDGIQTSNSANGRVKRLAKTVLEYIHGDMDATAATQSITALVTGKTLTKGRTA